MPSLIACAFLNNATVQKSDLLRLARRVYPYVAEEYFLRWTEDEIDVVEELLEDLGNHGLLSSSEDRAVWQRGLGGVDRCGAVFAARAPRCRSSSVTTLRSRYFSRRAAVD